MVIVDMGSIARNGSYVEEAGTSQGAKTVTVEMRCPVPVPFVISGARDIANVDILVYLETSRMTVRVMPNASYASKTVSSRSTIANIRTPEFTLNPCEGR